METPIAGYRILTEQEIETVNNIKSLGTHIETIVQQLKQNYTIDQRWVAIGVTDLQKGLMALTRAVTKPTNF